MTVAPTSAIDRRDALDAINRTNSHTAAPAIGVRLAIAIVAGVVAGPLTYWHFTAFSPHRVAHDFTWAWRGGQVLLAGGNPYEAIQPTGPYPFDSAFKYPLLDAVLAIPVARLSPALAVAIFGAVGVALLAFALTREGYWRLPVLASSPLWVTLVVGQWSTYTTAAALLPGLAWLAAVKPQAGLASFVYRPSRAMVLGGAVAYLVVTPFVPGWPAQWVRSMFNDPATHWYVPGVMLGYGAGALMLLAALRWRTPEGRLLLVLALIPQTQCFYSGLVALLVARTYRECLALAVISCIGYLGWTVAADVFASFPVLDPANHQGEWMLLGVYLPALVVVLRHPNVRKRSTVAVPA